MLENYVKIAFRNLVRHKAFSFINVFGLAIGMACSILIVLWVQDELSYDRFHPEAERTFRITAKLSDLGIHAAVTSAPLADALQSEIPEIAKAVRITGLNNDLLQVDDRIFEEKRILYVDSNFLAFFHFPLVQGDPETALKHPEGIIITESMARKYFGDVNPLGKTIRKNHKDDFTVRGVFKDVPANSHLQFDFIQPLAYLARTNNDLKNNIWDSFNYYTYVQLNASPAAHRKSLSDIEAKANEIYTKNEPGLKVQFVFQPLLDIHLRSNFLADFPGHGNIQYVYIFIVVGIFILAVACINFMNLATARSARRAKEVGLRKVAGAVRFQLIGQFLAESSLVAFIALVLAIVIVTAAIPAFNDLVGKSLTFELLNGKLMVALLTITLLTGLLAGSYPALFLSGFLPVKVLKGNLRGGAAGSMFRNTMVVIQFAVSITLLVGTAVIYNQLQFIQTKNLGFDKENLLYVPMTGDLWDKYQVFRNSLEGGVLTNEFSFVSELPTNLTNATVSVEWPGKDPDTQPLFSNVAVDDNFMDVFRVTLLNGRGFSPEFRTTDSANLIVNEKALEVIGMDAATAVGTDISLWGWNGTIIGVVKDFNFKPIQQPIEPLILRLNTWGGFAVVRSKPGQVEATIAELQSIVHELNPDYPFTYDFLDQNIANLYRAEQRLSHLFTIFAALAIFISCLGLYGLSAFLAERRTKEIGVRKVLGATVFHVVFLLSKTFTRPVFVAMVIAIPVAWMSMTYWLETFAYRIQIDWRIFLFAFLSALLIAWVTVSYECIKAAFANPAKSIRDE